MGGDARRHDGGGAVRRSRWLGGLQVEAVETGWRGDRAIPIFWLLVSIFSLVYVMNG